MPTSIPALPRILFKALLTFFFSQLIIQSAVAQTGSALHFDGVNDRVSIPHNNALNVSKLTIEFWIKWEGTSTEVNFVSGKNLEQLEIHTGGGGGSNGIRFIPTSGVYLDGPANILPTNVWTHIACVYDPSISLAKLYVNGVEKPLVNHGSNPISRPIDISTANYYLGARFNASFYLKGSLDEFRMWNRVLTQCEIQAAMNCQLPLPQNNLFLYYRFNQGLPPTPNPFTTTLIDSSGNAINGTLNNFALNGLTSNWITPGAITNTTFCTNPAIQLALTGGENPSCSGGQFTFTATATDLGAAPVFIWTKNGATIAGATGNSYTSNTLTNNDSIRCKVIGDCGKIISSNEIVIIRKCYVSTTGNDINPGTSWNSGLRTLQQAISNLATGGEIWLAKGTYYPDEGSGNINNNRNASFILGNKLTIYGGFAGTESLVTQRNFRSNLSILSGDVDQNDAAIFSNNSGNSLHVVKTNTGGQINLATLDGLTISGGNANGSVPDNAGGGIMHANSNINISNCIISGNAALDNGGGIYSDPASAATILNSSVVANTSNNGGGMYNGSATFNLVNCKFSGNKAVFQGGALYNRNAIAVINCSFSGNNATAGGIATVGGSTTISNCILWGDGGGEIYNLGGVMNFKYSLVQGILPAGPGNLDGNLAANNPVFIQQPDYSLAPFNGGILRLKLCSPAINRGDNTANNTITELDGNLRKTLTIDLGCYETGDGTKLYVKKDAAPGGNGSSWATAYNSLQDALAVSCSTIQQVWVARGTYYPDEGWNNSNNNRSATFSMRNNLQLYGGFAGVETLLTQRDVVANPSILSGDIDQNDSTNFYYSDSNSYHVVTCIGVNNSAVLDGFTVTAGRVTSGTQNGGGGIYVNSSTAIIRTCIFTRNRAEFGGAMVIYGSNPNIAGCTFSDNSTSTGSGGAIYADGTGGSATISYCSFSGNVSGWYGGALFIGQAPVTIKNSTFFANKSLNGGGAIFGSYSPAEITNCNFIGNEGLQGAVLWSQAGSEKIYNCIFAGNKLTSTQPGILYLTNSTAKVINCSFSGNSGNYNIYALSGNNSVTNCIIWGSGYPIYFPTGNVTVTNSLLQYITWQSTPSNLDGNNPANDPLFIQPATNTPLNAGNLRLQPNSPCINRGNSGANPTTSDLDGFPRFIGTIDMGAYEVQTAGGGTLAFYFRSKASGNWNDTNTWESSSDNVNWQDAFTTPDDIALAVNILANHLVTVTEDVTCPTVTVETDGGLHVNSGITFTISR